ncbi:MAG TPA: hypothetical protein VIV06_03650 [Candidatus Limnocylindrales bacterium]
MFATLAGRYPGPPAGSDAESGDGDPVDRAVADVVGVQEATGLELVSDGQVRWPDLGRALAIGLGGVDRADRVRIDASPAWTRPLTVAAWQSTSAATTRGVTKASLIGPCTLSAEIDGPLRAETLVLGLAEALNAEIGALQEAGCPFVEVIEDGLVRMGEARGTLFREAQRRLTAGREAGHLSLVVRGGNADRMGIDALFDAPYRSYCFDLVVGPDNWRLVAQAPRDRGIICGALDARPGASVDVDVLVWAAQYAASTGRRGLDRVGLAPSGDLDALSWGEARRRLEVLGRAARLAVQPGVESGRALDPRAVDIRSAALGRFMPRVTPPARITRPSRAAAPTDPPRRD